ncbi:hypothetical protein B1757_02805 [Acidithiobacillus marinus]|uniref:Uncharacterized protein n=1 Tax=Acidithiobacillus marinus TaxID=187490 RepID=A0A2I1DPE5_9PROT|nr:hypothetical protein [Acidithiobacillus marinus]PKY11737.1 hypothetical protein B1757_02805 [Acidithiobacillus marinus]
MNFTFNHRLRNDIIRTFNVLAYAGGTTQLGAVAYNLWVHDKGMAGFLAAIGYILVCKSVVWLIMACED